MPPMPWMAGQYGNEPSGFGPRAFNDFHIARGGEAQSMFFMKILCSSKRVGGVIGGGGSVVKRLEQETGTRIDVADSSAGSDYCVIRVSALEVPWDPRSRTIDAILRLQDKTSEESEKGVITTRLLLPSSKVGCILGQGGQVINEMRRRTKADIRINSKQDKPKCAGHDEQLVQVSGSYGVAKDALAEISSRFRDRCLRDAIPGPEPSSFVPGLGYGPRGRIPVEMPNLSGTIGLDHSGGYEPFKARKRARSSLDVDSAKQNYSSQNAEPPDPLLHQTCTMAMLKPCSKSQHQKELAVPEEKAWRVSGLVGPCSPKHEHSVPEEKAEETAWIDLEADSPEPFGFRIMGADEGGEEQALYYKELDQDKGYVITGDFGARVAFGVRPVNLEQSPEIKSELNELAEFAVLEHNHLLPPEDGRKHLCFENLQRVNYQKVRGGVLHYVTLVACDTSGMREEFRARVFKCYYGCKLLDDFRPASDKSCPPIFGAVVSRTFPREDLMEDETGSEEDEEEPKLTYSTKSCIHEAKRLIPKHQPGTFLYVKHSNPPAP